MTATRIRLGALVGAAAIVCFSTTLGGAPGAAAQAPAKDAPAPKPEDNRVSVAVARDRAKLLHDVYSATLDSMHHHFFRRERAVLPARAMEDVFDEIDKKSGIRTRWIAVNTPAMSVNHEPKTEFEKKAAAEIAAGKSGIDRVEEGYYLRAGAIPLGAGCVGCHTKFGGPNEKTPRFAGLVIAIPVKGE